MLQLREITIEEILKNPDFQLIDVRSPSEFQDSHIPSSVNIPLFSDQERAEIGTVYKQEGEEQAKWLAMEIVSPKIPHLMSQIKNIVHLGKEPAIYCWRGGMRSKAVTTFATILGLPVVRLIGGYKVYRQHVMENLGPHLLPNKVIVVHGMTGVGKSYVLQALSEQGLPVLDLEGCANHRGSVFGDFGLQQPHGQKMFESLLFKRLNELKDSHYLIIEAESKRIGRAILPDFLVEAKKQALT